jgi:tetratricopeptide (TPR) repeat protein
MKTSTLILALLFALPRVFQDPAEGHRHALPMENVGSVSFPVSCAPEVQKAFNLGVALLHSYWYEEAEKQFEEVAAKDPKCSMAYWGEAMTLHRPAYSEPSQQDLQRGRMLLQKAENLGTKIGRERGYIAALAAFYAGEKVDYKQRASAWCQGMEKVYAAFPKDHEAAAFYALSLLVSEPSDDKSLSNSRKAIQILNRLLGEEPNHPGATHYLIHAADNPNLAKLGLPAARRYAQIAPAVPHALHMPSHIFARLGLWEEDIQSNLASLAAARRTSTMHVGAENQVHAMEFLEYAYLQIGLNDKAGEMIGELQRILKEDLNPGLEDYLDWHRSQFPARYALETRSWKDAIALQTPPDSEPRAAAVTYWARAIGAGHLRDTMAARDAVMQYDAMVQATRNGLHPARAKSMETNRDEAHAWLAFAQGKNEEALNLLRPIAEKQDAFGKGEVELPAREMLADMLLEMGRTQEALAEYEKSEKTDPNRFNGLYGAARAAELMNHLEKAAQYYSQLQENCSERVHLQRSELAEARGFLVKNKSRPRN